MADIIGRQEGKPSTQSWNGIAFEQVCLSHLERRVESLRKSLKVKGTVFPTLVTTYGLKYNMYSGIFQNMITLDDLFN